MTTHFAELANTKGLGQPDDWVSRFFTAYNLLVSKESRALGKTDKLPSYSTIFVPLAKLLQLV